MKLSFEEADFLMHLIGCDYDECRDKGLSHDYKDSDGRMILSHEQIENLFQKLQEEKFKE